MLRLHRASGEWQEERVSGGQEGERVELHEAIQEQEKKERRRWRPRPSWEGEEVELLHCFLTFSDHQREQGEV